MGWNESRADAGVGVWFVQGASAAWGLATALFLSPQAESVRLGVVRL